jgi:hypothetical protein
VSAALTDEQLVGVLTEYLGILQTHPSPEDMMDRILTPDFETRRGCSQPPRKA